jgi:hypothetical protein
MNQSNTTLLGRCRSLFNSSIDWLESRTGENAPLKLLRNAAQTAGAPTFAERSHSTPVKGGSLRKPRSPLVKA